MIDDMNAGDVIKQARQQAGMTQAALAANAHTSQPTIAAYETGTKQPSVRTLDRLVRAAGSQLSWHLPSGPLADIVDAMASALDRDDDDEAFRLLADLAVRLETADPDLVEQAIRVDPGSTRRLHWDALVGGIAERLAHNAGLSVPSWTIGPNRKCETFWFVTSYPSLHASALLNSPPELTNRGVFCDKASLTGV